VVAKKKQLDKGQFVAMGGGLIVFLLTCIGLYVKITPDKFGKTTGVGTKYRRTKVLSRR